MSTLATGNRLTLVELAKRTKNGAVVAIAETLNKVNSILDDAVYTQANDQTSHTTTSRTSLPTGSWRKINQGVAREASHTKQIVEKIGMLEAYSQVDTALVDLSDDPAGFRMSEDLAFIEGMSQTLATAIIYGSTVGYPEKFNGLATRYATLTTYGTSAVHNVHTCAGTGSALTSIWVVCWGPDVSMIYPRNSRSVGIDQKDDGELTVYDTSNNPYKVYQTHFKILTGLCIRDDRCVQRIANILTSTCTIWDNILINALREIPAGTYPVIYANKAVLSMMDKDAKDKTNVNYGPPDAWGRPTMNFRGIPVKQVDAILSTETAIS